MEIGSCTQLFEQASETPGGWAPCKHWRIRMQTCLGWKLNFCLSVEWELDIYINFTYRKTKCFLTHLGVWTVHLFSVHLMICFSRLRTGNMGLTCPAWLASLLEDTKLIFNHIEKLCSDLSPPTESTVTLENSFSGSYKSL